MMGGFFVVFLSIIRPMSIRYPHLIKSAFFHMLSGSLFTNRTVIQRCILRDIEFSIVVFTIK
jgi:hypothetical protein